MVGWGHHPYYPLFLAGALPLAAFFAGLVAVRLPEDEPPGAALLPLTAFDTGLIADSVSMGALRRELGASTETLLEKSLPKIMSLDAALKADELTFSIPRSWLPTPMYKKAAKALADPAKYVKVVDSTDPPDADGMWS